jgi:S-disulfanyl-L-cysteine oxidoreductase SoxD
MRNNLIALSVAALLAASGVAHAQSSSTAPSADASAPASAAASASAAPAAARSVLDGVYTDAQADTGAEEISQHCAQCHNNSMRGGPGGPSVIANLYPTFGDQPLTSLYDYISTQMPKGQPGSLAPDEYVAITARILQLGGAPSGTTELPADEDALGQITLEQKK